MLFVFLEHWELHSRALGYLSVPNSQAQERTTSWFVLEHHGQRVGAQDGGKILENMFWRKRLIHILWVNYMLDADGLDRELNICKVFVMGVYH